MAFNAVREIKLCLLGDSGVGKSCLAMRFVHDRFEIHSTATIGASFMSKNFRIEDQAFKFQIWDTAGQEKYKALAPMYYRGAAAAVVVYDITLEQSFESVKRWIKELRQMGPQNIVIAIAGNKKDLVDQREVTTETGQSFADEIGAVFAECSALNAENVNDIFEQIGQKLPPEQPAFQHQGFPDKKKPEEKKCC
ncbi:ras-related protein Rab-22A-like [Clytia hemisphaerica]|uniref:ras-related protein Rab-22A-like n=1 Tax=Clytia hemisphaerica TaxID=252671 RepID=UPI0034D654A9